MRRLLLLAAAVTVTLTVVPSSAIADGAVSVRATIDGRDLQQANSSSPLVLDPARQVVVHVELANGSAAPLDAPLVRIRGHVVGLTFLAYETEVDLVVPPGTTGQVTYPLRLIGLTGQATGLIPTNLEILDNHREVIAAVDFTSDVKGSLRSLYGYFGLAMILATGLFLLGSLLALARGRLPLSRWRRGIRFAVAGITLGLALTFGVSALRIFVPAATVWGPLIGVSVAALFLLGYVTPAPPGAVSTTGHTTVGLQPPFGPPPPPVPAPPAPHQQYAGPHPDPGPMSAFPGAPVPPPAPAPSLAVRRGPRSSLTRFRPTRSPTSSGRAASESCSGPVIAISSPTWPSSCSRSETPTPATASCRRPGSWPRCGTHTWSTSTTTSKPASTACSSWSTWAAAPSGTVSTGGSSTAAASARRSP
jgi:hypothetical protein